MVVILHQPTRYIDQKDTGTVVRRSLPLKKLADTKPCLINGPFIQDDQKFLPTAILETISLPLYASKTFSNPNEGSIN